MRLSRFLFSVYACTAALLTAVAPTTTLAAGNTIVVGQAIDLSGPNAALGRDYVAGIKTCFDMVNAAGGIGGKRLQYLVRDDQGQPDVSARAAAELIERDQADYLLGGVGDDTLQAIMRSAAFVRSGQILFAPLAAAEHASGGRVLFWRPSYKQELRHIFAHFHKLGIDEVGVAYQDTPSNAEAYRALAAELRERRMKLSGTAKIDAGSGQLAAEARRLAASRPGFVLVLADTISTALFLKEYRRHDAQTFVAGTSLINLATLRELAGAQAVVWTVFSQVVPNPSAGTSVIQIEHMNMMKKFRDETLSSLTLEGFAAAKVFVKALQQSKRPRQALQDFVAQGGEIDLGGLSVVSSGTGNRLSSYVDIALFRKGGGLIF